MTLIFFFFLFYLFSGQKQNKSITNFYNRYSLFDPEAQFSFFFFFFFYRPQMVFPKIFFFFKDFFFSLSLVLQIRFFNDFKINDSNPMTFEPSFFQKKTKRSIVRFLFLITMFWVTVLIPKDQRKILFGFVKEKKTWRIRKKKTKKNMADEFYLRY